jgi:CRP-like cAMP-binding protein
VLVKKFDLTEPYTTLPRGGYLVDTSAGYIQFGSPPETIKDTMMLPEGTPQIFVLPNKFFHVEKGISVAELEFPIYYNHFLRQKKTYIICDDKQRDQLKIVLNESLFGPEIIDIRSEYMNGEESYGFPDLKAEMEHFRGGRKFEDLVQFGIFKNDQVKVNQVVITRTENGFVVEDGIKKKRVVIPGEVGYNIIQDTGGRLPEPFKPPLIGITCLGPSHGFDPEENTSGFILWINHQGIMIDPPVNTTEWLRDANVNPKLSNSIILTHCHADHDAGTFQKILEEGKVTIYSSETVMHSFIRKYHALTQIPIKELFTLFDFVPVIIGKSYMINGARFHFKYSLHSIPTLSFECVFEDQSFLYSSDHLNDPEKYNELYLKGVLMGTRYKDLLDFPWHHKIIYHESGVPGLHTRIAYLNSLPEEVQKKITVYHIAKKDMVTDTHLTIAKFGIENTLYPPVRPPRHEQAYRILDVLSNLDIFKNFPIAKAKEFLAIVEEEHFKRGDTIIRKNTPGDKFYIIVSGNVKVIGMDLENASQTEGVMKRYGSYEYFGEASLVLNQPRSADVVAETDVVALTIEENRFLNFIRDSDLLPHLAKLNDIRKTGTWEILSNSRFFKGITSAQKTQLEFLMEQRNVPVNSILIEEGKKFDEVFIIKSGLVDVLSKGQSVDSLTRGDFCGEIFQLQKNAPSTFTFRTSVASIVYAVHRDKLIRYIAENPGVYMRLNYVFGR